MTQLAYGWWEPKRRAAEMPPTLKDPKNYVLTAEELKAYDDLLTGLIVAVEEERKAVLLNYKAITYTTQQPVEIRWNQRVPRCTSVAHVLEFMLKTGRVKKAVMELLVGAAQKRREAREVAQRG
jgi:hypothetical protein